MRKLEYRKVWHVLVIVLSGLLMIGLYHYSRTAIKRADALKFMLTAERAVSYEVMTKYLHTPLEQMIQVAFDQEHNGDYINQEFEVNFESYSVNSVLGIDWQQTSYQPCYVTFLTEERVVKSKAVPLVVGMRCSPSFAFLAFHFEWDSLSAMRYSNIIQPLSDDRVKIKSYAEAFADSRRDRTFQECTNSACHHVNDNLPYNPHEEEICRCCDEIFMLESYSNAYDIVINAVYNCVKDNQYFNTKLTDVTLVDQTVDELRRRLANRRYMRMLYPQLLKRFSQAKFMANLVSVPALGLIAMLLVIQILSARQIFKPNLLNLVCGLLVKAGVRDTGVAIRLVQDYYADNPWQYWYQPSISRLQPCFELSVSNLKRQQDSDDISQQAEHIMLDLDKSHELQAQFNLCLDQERSFIHRRSALDQLQAELNKQIKEREESVKPKPEPVESTAAKRVAPKQTRLLRALNKLPDWIRVMQDDQVWQQRSPRELEVLTAYADFFKEVDEKAVPTLLTRKDLTQLLRSNSDFMRACRGYDVPAVAEMLGLTVIV